MSGQQEILNALRAAAPKLEVVDAAEAVAAKSHDYWMRSLLQRRMGVTQRGLAVARPSTTAEVSSVLTWARKTKTSVVPFGLGSGVVGGVLPERDQLVLDMSAMDKITSINDNSLTVTVQAGMRGSTFEEQLNAKGFTMGHFPQSIALSTVGGWCATRASGQHSTLYGNIENMLLGCEIVLPGGQVITLPSVPRSAAGPDLRHIFMGAEGVLGVFTELTYRIHPLPETQKGRAYAFADLAAPIEVLRKTLRAGWTPSVTRLYDSREAGRNFAGVAAEGSSVLLVLSEGPSARVEAELEAIAALVKEHRGTDHGDEPVKSWIDHRNDVPTFESLLDQGLVADTIEIAASWEKLVPLWEAVVERGSALDGMLVVSGHISHSYTQGANIYFTFAGAKEEMADRLKLYDQAWDTILDATHEHGGTIAHHHGIGRMRKEWLKKELGGAHDLLVALKRAFDPDNIMNPGALLDA